MEKTLTRLRNIACICLGLIFFTAGMSKLYAGHAFPGLIGPVWLEDRLAEYGLGLFARFVAWGQVLVGFLLLTLRFSTLGAVMLVPIVLNILMVTISMEWRGTPYILAFLLASNLFVLFVDRHKLWPILDYHTYPGPVHQPKSKRGNLIWGAGLVLVLGSIPLSQVQLQLAWGICVAGLVLSWFSIRADKANP